MSDSFWTEMGKQLPSAAYERGREAERAAIVAMLRDPNWADMSGLYVSDHIERGEHTWSDDE